MDPQELTQLAFDNLFTNVHNRVFFQKCAAAGYYPHTAEDAYWMLETAGKLRALDELGQMKLAQEYVSPYAVASAALDSLIAPQPEYVPEEYAIKQAAWELAHDPGLYESALLLNAAQAANTAMM